MFSRNLKLVAFILVAGTIAAYVILVTIPTQLAKRSYEAAQKLGEDFSKAFQFTPEVIVNNTIVLNQQTPVLELATISQNFNHQYEWKNTWLRSTKQISITGTFETKAGFDLNKKFSIRLDGDKATVRLPAPQILSVESLGDIAFRDEDGIWNWVNEEDRSKATNAFILDARKYAEGASFVKDSKTVMEERLKKMLTPYAKEVVIMYDEEIPSKQ